MIRTALICALIVVEFDVVRAYFALLYPALILSPNLWVPLAFLPVVMYIAIGFVLSRRGVESGTAIRAVATAAFADVLVGVPLSRLIEQGALPTIVYRDYLSAVALTVVVNTALGAGGIWLGSIGRGMLA